MCDTGPCWDWGYVLLHKQIINWNHASVCIGNRIPTIMWTWNNTAISHNPFELFLHLVPFSPLTCLVMFDMCAELSRLEQGMHWLQREVANVCSKVPAVSRPVTFLSFPAHFQDPSPRLQSSHSPAPETPASLRAGGGCYHGNKRLCSQGTHP